MSSNNSIKSIALKTYVNNFLPSIVVTVLVMFCYFINYNISSVIALIAGGVFGFIFNLTILFLTILPVFLGFIRYFWRIVCGVTDNPISLFYYFSSFDKYKRAIKLAFSLTIKTVFYYVFFIIPSLLLEIFASEKFYDFLKIPIPLWSANLSNVALFFKFLALSATIFLLLKFHLAPMLAVADENMDIDEAIHLSKIISKTATFDFLFLVFSFIGWVLLSLLVVPIIFTLPYFIIAYLLYSSNVVNRFNDKIKILNNDESPTYIAGV